MNILALIDSAKYVIAQGNCSNLNYLLGAKQLVKLNLIYGNPKIEQHPWQFELSVILNTTEFDGFHLRFSSTTLDGMFNNLRIAVNLIPPALLEDSPTTDPK